MKTTFYEYLKANGSVRLLNSVEKYRFRYGNKIDENTAVQLLYSVGGFGLRQELEFVELQNSYNKFS